MLNQQLKQIAEYLATWYPQTSSTLLLVTVSEQRPAYNVGCDNVANKTWLREAMPRQEGFG